MLISDTGTRLIKYQTGDWVMYVKKRYLFMLVLPSNNIGVSLMFRRCPSISKFDRLIKQIKMIKMQSTSIIFLLFVSTHA